MDFSGCWCWMRLHRIRYVSTPVVTSYTSARGTVLPEHVLSEMATCVCVTTKVVRLGKKSRWAALKITGSFASSGVEIYKHLRRRQVLRKIKREILATGSAQGSSIHVSSLSNRQKMCWHVAGNAVSLFVEHKFLHLTTSYIFIPVSGGFLFILSLLCGNLPW